MSDEQQQLSRRRALGVAALGAGAPILVACASDTEPTGSDPATSGDPSPPDTSSASPTNSPNEETGAAGQSLVATSEVPVGGGVVLAGDRVVVTQPTEGDFRAFTAVCTHAQCVVERVDDTSIMCGCHGSRFAIEDGSVVNGPAAAPLAEFPIVVEGDQVVRA